MSIVLNINFTVVGLVVAAGLLLLLVIALPTFRNRILGVLAAAAALVAGYYYVLSPVVSTVKEWWVRVPEPIERPTDTETPVSATSWVPDIAWTEWFWKLLPFVAALAALILFVALLRRIWSGGGDAPRASWFPWRTLFQLMGILLVVGLVAAGIGHWPKIEAWLTAHNFSTAEFSAYVSSMDTVAKVLLGAALFGVFLLALGGGVRSVAAVGALAALFLVLHSVSWSEVKKDIVSWSASETSAWFVEGTCDGKMRTIHLTENVVSINRGANCYLDLEIPEGPIAVIGEGQVKIMHRPEPFNFRASHWKCAGKSRCTVEAIFCPTGTIWHSTQKQCVRRYS